MTPGHQAPCKYHDITLVGDCHFTLGVFRCVHHGQAAGGPRAMVAGKIQYAFMLLLYDS